MRIAFITKIKKSSNDSPSTPHSTSVNDTTASYNASDVESLAEKEYMAVAGGAQVRNDPEI